MKINFSCLNILIFHSICSRNSYKLVYNSRIYQKVGPCQPNLIFCDDQFLGEDLLLFHYINQFVEFYSHMFEVGLFKMKHE